MRIYPVRWSFSLAAVGCAADLATKTWMFDPAHLVPDAGRDPWWIWRLKGMVLGALLGVVISLLLPVGGHLELIGRAFTRPPTAGIGIPALQALNGLLAGGLIGLLSGARGLFVGWVAGALLWMTEYIAYFIISTAANSLPSDGGLHLFNCVLLSPVLGGLFGAAVGAGCSAILSAASRLRPEIR